MKKFITVFFATIFVLPFFSCGKKGDILPPLIRFPQAVENFQVAQKADQIILTWKNPIAYEDGSALAMIERIEIWILEESAAQGTGAAEMPVEEFQQKASIHTTIPEDQIQDYLAQEGDYEGQMLFAHRFSGKAYLSKRYTYGIRVKDKKRFSPFSVLMSLKPMVLPFPPAEVSATVFADRIEVQWNPPVKNLDQSTPSNVEGYNIYRSAEEENFQRLNVTLVKDDKYSDKNFEYDRKYTYFVRASATAAMPYLESEDSEKIEISPRDTFAPAAPKGLISVAGQDVLSITWDANTENDLDGYRVWRREEGTAEFQLLTPEAIKENAYNDRAVKKGTTYMYIVTALDKSGNESKRSKRISDRIRERMQ
jgi:hypothetical protein